MEAKLPEITAVALSSDGGRLAVACHETATVTLFSTVDGTRKGQLQFLGNPKGLSLETQVWVTEMAFSEAQPLPSPSGTATGGRLVVCPSSERGVVTSWDLDLPELPADLDASPELEELNVEVCTVGPASATARSNLPVSLWESVAAMGAILATELRGPVRQVTCHPVQLQMGCGVASHLPGLACESPFDGIAPDLKRRPQEALRAGPIAGIEPQKRSHQRRLSFHQIDRRPRG